MRYRFRKINAVSKGIMSLMREMGWAYNKIARYFQINTSTAQYHLIPKYRKRTIERAIKNRKSNPYKKDKEYLRNYMRERYNNDKEFRERVKASIKRYQKKSRHQQSTSQK